MVALKDQEVVPASVATKIRVSLLATAMVDALGGPAEFHNRFSFPLVTSLIPNANFSLQPGVWTDDTSMTLCLARSLATYTPPSPPPPSPSSSSPSSSINNADKRTVIGGFDEKHQLDLYSAWNLRGELSAIGRCFDIGNSISRALHAYQRLTVLGTLPPDKIIEKIRKDQNKEVFAGNGSLMRILPIGLAYWRNDALARELAKRSSATTHSTSICLEACEVWTGAIVRIIQNANTPAGEEGKDGPRKTLNKLDLLEYFSSFPYTNKKLKEALTISSTPLFHIKSDDKEKEFQKYHPILVAIKETKKKGAADGFTQAIPDAKRLPSSGYVLHTLVAALYCFLATETFEEGAILAVNLGDDADTVGAVYGGLAGVWYAAEEGAGDVSKFWTERVSQWKEGLVARDVVEGVAEDLVKFSEKLAEEY